MNKFNILILVFVSILFGCGGSSTDTQGDKSAKLTELKKQYNEIGDQISQLEKEINKENGNNGSSAKVNLVAARKAQPEVFNHYIELQGRIASDKEINVNPKIPGIVTRILVEVGAQVKAGQTLALLDDAVANQGLAELQHGIDFARDVYEKQKSLWDQKIGSEIQYLSAKSNLESLEKKMKTMLEQVDHYKIKSPIAGTVDQIDIKIGQAASPGFPCIKVVNTSRLKAKADLAEAYLAKVKAGNQVLIHLPDIDKNIATRNKYVGQSVSALNRTFPVEADLSGNLDGVRPNMMAVFKIVDYSKPNCFVLPINVVQKGMDGDFVLLGVQKGDKWIAQKVPVKTGLYYNDKIEIKEGLKSGDLVIETGFQELNNGDFIEIQK